MSESGFWTCVMRLSASSVCVPAGAVGHQRVVADGIVGECHPRAVRVAAAGELVGGIQRVRRAIASRVEAGVLAPRGVVTAGGAAA